MTTVQHNAERLRRLRWHCRRGLLELDLTLTRFLDENLSGMTEEELDTLELLLEYDDTDFWALITRPKKLADPRLDAMLGRLRAMMTTTTTVTTAQNLPRTNV